MHPQPLTRASFRHVKAIFTDVDGTLTTDTRLAASTIRALERLADRNVPVVLVTGRPAGFAECWMRTLPVAGVIAENGGLYFVGARKVYARPKTLKADRQRLQREIKLLLKSFPGVRLSTDSVFTEVDLAIDYNEEVHLGPAVAEEIVAWLRARGLNAVRSSVHVNTWVGAFDKRTMVEHFLEREWRVSLRPRDTRYVYVGDSLNDAPLFARFALSVGVANVLKVLQELDAPPRYVTRRAEGAGFVEVAQAVLRGRAR